MERRRRTCEFKLEAVKKGAQRRLCAGGVRPGCGRVAAAVTPALGWVRSVKWVLRKIWPA
jgi:hypothetical protein